MRPFQNEADFDDNTVSLSDLARIMREYSRPILLSIVAAGVLYVLGTIAVLLWSPPRRITTQPFRLEFTGADKMQYPNGTKFTTSEIISTPILVQVHTANRLGDFVDFPTFKDSVFITESNPALEALEHEYRAKLAEPKLSAVDRARFEVEFEQKKSSLSRSHYALNYLDGGSVKTIPESVKNKVLSDILRVWAEQTVRNKGVVLYDLPILSSGIFEREVLDTYDYVIALDMMRSKIGRIIANIDALRSIPGAEVVRTRPPSRASLAELRVRLEDAVRFKIEPLVGMILRSGISKNPDASIDFLQTRLTFNGIELQEAAARVDTMRRSLDMYTRQSLASAAGTQPFAGQGVQGQTIIPQIDDTFLDRLIALTSERDDSEFRQALIARMESEALKVVPLEAEARYYTTLIDSLRGFEARARDAAPEELASMRAQVDAILAEAIRATEEVNQIYRSVSDNLNPSTVLYTTTGPATTASETALMPGRMVLLGVLALALTAILASIASLMHARIVAGKERRDEVEIRPGADAVAAVTAARSEGAA